MTFFHILLQIVCPNAYALLPANWTNFDCIQDKIDGGNKYVYSIENNKLILKDQYSNTEIVFRKIE